MMWQGLVGMAMVIGKSESREVSGASKSDGSAAAGGTKRRRPTAKKRMASFMKVPEGERAG